MSRPRTLKLTINGDTRLKDALDDAGYAGAVQLRAFVPINNSATTVYITLHDSAEDAPADTSNGIPIDSSVGKSFAFESNVIEFNSEFIWLYSASSVDILAVIGR